MSVTSLEAWAAATEVADAIAAETAAPRVGVAL